MITGTIRNTVQLACLDQKWQQRKEKLAAGKPQEEMTAEERQLAHYQKELADMRENNRQQELTHKMAAGAKLTPDEIEYLRKNDPQQLKEYEELEQEREAYKEELKNCRSKDDVDELRLSKMGEFMAEAKKIANNPCIPKSQKVGMLAKIIREASVIQEEHLAFEKSLRYQQLPEESEEKRSESLRETEERSGEEKLPGVQMQEDEDEKLPSAQMEADEDAGEHTLQALGALLDLAADGATMEAAAGTDISINVVC